MRHRKAGRQFGRDTSSRRAMFRNLAANLITHERIETTDAKAKELRRIVERLVSKAKRIGPVAYTPRAELVLPEAERARALARRLHVARLLESYLPRFGVAADGSQVNLPEKVLTQLAKRFAERPGGYTRVIKASIRRGDGAPMSYIELVDAAPVADKVEAAEQPATDIQPAAAEPAAVESAPSEA